MANPAQAQQTSLLLMKAGAMVNVTDAKLKVVWRLGQDPGRPALLDADAMYKNDGKAVADKYGYDERQALLQLVAGLQRRPRRTSIGQKKFKEAKAVANISKRAVETCYNYLPGWNPRALWTAWGW